MAYSLHTAFKAIPIKSNKAGTVIYNTLAATVLLIAPGFYSIMKVLKQ